MATDQKSDKVEKAAQVAQVFTVVAAACYGLWWIIKELFRIKGTGADVVENILLLILIIGGLAMGLLYAFGGGLRKVGK